MEEDNKENKLKILAKDSIDLLLQDSNFLEIEAPWRLKCATLER